MLDVVRERGLALDGDGVRQPAEDGTEERCDVVDPGVLPLTPISPGPNVRAGLTEAPLNGIAARWIITSVSGIATRAVVP